MERIEHDKPFFINGKHHCLFEYLSRTHANPTRIYPLKPLLEYYMYECSICMTHIRIGPSWDGGREILVTSDNDLFPKMEWADVINAYDKYTQLTGKHVWKKGEE